MNSKNKGGRPSEGPLRTIRCSDEKWARMELAAMLKGKKSSVSEIMREGGSELADRIIREHLEALSTLELTNDLIKQIAAEYLKKQ